MVVASCFLVLDFRLLFDCCLFVLFWGCGLCVVRCVLLVLFIVFLLFVVSFLAFGVWLIVYGVLCLMFVASCLFVCRLLFHV